MAFLDCILKAQVGRHTMSSFVCISKVVQLYCDWIKVMRVKTSIHFEVFNFKVSTDLDTNGSNA